MGRKPFFKATPPPPAGHCLNCGVDLQGRYCHSCGQEHTQRPIRFSMLLGEGIAEVLNWDSKLLRSLRPLLFRPGLLTQEYVKGRRVRYVSPVRFYLIGSLLFFLIFDPSLNREELTPAFESDKPTARKADVAPVFEDEAPIAASPDSMDTTGRENPDSTKTSPQADVVHKDPDSSPREGLEIFGLEEFADTSSEWGRAIDRINTRAKKDKGLTLLGAFLENIPTLLFLMMPFAALLLWFVYLVGRRRYDYMEHLVFTLHMHAFVYFYLLLTYGADQLAVWLLGWSQYLLFGISLAAIPVYFYQGMRRYYGQSRWVTFAKMSLIGVLYVLVAAVFVTIAILVMAGYLYI